MAAVDPCSEQPPPENRLGELAVLAGHLSQPQLDDCLQLQRELRAQGLRKRVGALLIERELLDREQLTQLLKTQRIMRDLAGEAEGEVLLQDAPRLSERQNNLLGEVLISQGLLDEELLEQCVKVQAAYARRGLDKKIGEIIIETACLDPHAVDAALAHQAEERPATTAVPGIARHLVSPADEEAFCEVALARRLEESEVLRIRTLRAALQVEGLERWVGSLAIELGLASAEEISRLEELTSRRLLHRGSWIGLPSIGLTDDEDERLRRYLLRERAIAAEQWDAACRAQQTYARSGIEKRLGSVLVEMQLIDPGLVSHALTVQGRTDNLTRRYHRVERRAPKAGRRRTGRFRIDVVRQGAGPESYSFDDGQFLIGRAAPGGLEVGDPQATKNHARISVEEGTVYLEDLGSRNGILVGETRVERVALISGQQFQIGETRLRFTDRRAIDEVHPDALLGVREPAEGEPRAQASAPCATDLDDTHANLAVLGSEASNAPDELDRIRSAFKQFYAQEDQLREPEEPVAERAPAPGAALPYHRGISSRRAGLPRSARLLLTASLLLLVLPVGLALAWSVRPLPEPVAVEETAAEAASQEPAPARPAEDVEAGHRRFEEEMSRRGLVAHRGGWKPSGERVSRQPTAQKRREAEREALKQKMARAGYVWDGKQWQDTRPAPRAKVDEALSELVPPRPPEKGSFSVRLRYVPRPGRYRVMVGGRIRAPNQVLDLALVAVNPTRGQTASIAVPLRRGRFACDLGPYPRPLFPGIYCIRLRYRKHVRDGADGTAFEVVKEVEIGDRAAGRERLATLTEDLRETLAQGDALIPALRSSPRPTGESLRWLQHIERVSLRTPWTVTPYPRTREALSRLLDRVQRHARKPDYPGLLEVLDRANDQFVAELLESERGLGQAVAVAGDLAAAIGSVAPGGKALALDAEQRRAVLAWLRECARLEATLTRGSFEKAQGAYLRGLAARLRWLDRQHPEAFVLYQVLNALLRRWSALAGASARAVAQELPELEDTAARATTRAIRALEPRRLPEQLVLLACQQTRRFARDCYQHLLGKPAPEWPRSRALEMSCMRRLERTRALSELLGWPPLVAVAAPDGRCRKALDALTALYGELAAEIEPLTRARRADKPHQDKQAALMARLKEIESTLRRGPR